MATEDNAVLLRVGAGSDASKLASAISHALYDGKDVSLRAIGAGAVNQAVKGLAIAQSFVGSRGITILGRHSFATVPMDDGESVSAIVIKVVTTT